MTIKYSDQLMIWLRELGYTHCLFLAGGGSMHLLDSASKYFECIPFVHEVSAAIATEYFNESTPGNKKAFCLVTTGPGLTNTVTALSGAWLESHELLVIAGQVKKSDLATNGLRQRGIQELPGIEIVSPITKCAIRIENPILENEFKSLVSIGYKNRKGPVVFEVCIDASAAPFENKQAGYSVEKLAPVTLTNEQFSEIASLVKKSKRPLVMLGAGISRPAADEFINKVRGTSIPIASTWSGADRVPSTYDSYAGRPNTFGMRWANIFQQQCDLLISIGARLGIQQTGFNWQEFCPLAKIVMIDIDPAEISKGHPKIEFGICANADVIAPQLAELIIENLSNIDEWTFFLSELKEELPIIEQCHEVRNGFVDPYKFIKFIEACTLPSDLFAPGTSGGTHTAFYQAFYNKDGQKIIPNKGLASMGYGMAGAIGAALANPYSRIINFEGDGSFSQNSQELATIAKNDLNIKLFITSNNGYASIRTSQISYFDNNYLGCDEESGLGFPDLQKLAAAFGIKYLEVNSNYENSSELKELFDSKSPVLFEIKADPNQLYLPKITSAINKTGAMTSNPLHLMSPELSDETANKVFRFFKE